MFRNLKAKIYETQMKKRVGKEVIENIRKVLYEECAEKTKGMSKEEFEDYEFWSDNWVEFLESTKLELMYDIVPVIKNDNVIDIVVEIQEV